MSRAYVVELRDGSKLGPWITTKAGARAAALRTLGGRKLPRGSVLREWTPPTSRKTAPEGRSPEGGAPRRGLLCDRCGKPDALLTGRIGARHLDALCAECDGGKT